MVMVDTLQIKKNKTHSSRILFKAETGSFTHFTAFGCQIQVRFRRQMLCSDTSLYGSLALLALMFFLQKESQEHLLSR